MDTSNSKLCKFLIGLGNRIPLAESKGFTIVENLVAIALVGIALVGITPLCVTCFNGNAATRSYASLEADIQKLVDGYKNLNYAQLLAKFGGSALAITNGQSTTESGVSQDGHTTYQVTFEALKSTPNGMPEAVSILVDATQKRGKLASANFTFQTMIAQVN